MTNLNLFQVERRGEGHCSMLFGTIYSLSICPLEGSFTANQYKVSLRGFAFILVITG